MNTPSIQEIKSFQLFDDSIEKRLRVVLHFLAQSHSGSKILVFRGVLRIYSYLLAFWVFVLHRCWPIGRLSGNFK